MGLRVDNLSWYSAFIYLFGAIVGFADPITDILTLVIFYCEDHKTWFGVALTVVILPCLFYPLFYCVFQVDRLEEASRVRCALYILLNGCNPFSNVVARLRCFIFCFKNCEKICKDQKYEFDEHAEDLLAYGEASAFIEAFLESTPQFVLQLYVMVVQPEQVNIIQMISLPVSLLSLTWAYMGRDTLFLSSRDITETKHKVMLFVTHLFLLSSRLFAIGLFTVTFKWWIIGVLLLHSSLAVTLYIIRSCRRESCSANKCFGEALYLIIVFCFQWVRDDVFSNLEEIKHTQLFWNLWFIVENIAMILSFYFVSQFSSNWYSLPVTICVCLFSVVGSAGRLTHFYFLHKMAIEKIREKERENQREREKIKERINAVTPGPV